MEAVSVDHLADAWEQAWSGGDPGAFAALCAPDLHYEDPLTPTPLHGVPALVEHAERLWRAFPGVRLERAGVRLEDGRFTAFPVRASGRNTGPLDGLLASHREVDLHAVFWCELDMGRTRLWRVRAIYDAYDAAVTLGLIPRPGTLRNRALLALQGYGLLRSGG
jgi:SnoaL-like polyketide cyclase